MSIEIHEGLEGVYATRTRLSRPDGKNGKLTIAGYWLEDIAPYATFEEMTYLLWNNELPNKSQLEAFRAKWAELRAIPDATLALIRAAAEIKQDPMDVVRMCVGSLSLLVDKKSEFKDLAEMLVATMPTIVASYWRVLNGLEPIEPRRDLRHAANYLYMLTGEVPKAEFVRSLETYLNTVIDHGLNASTFTARVIISTQSDLISAITGAIGALKGPLHGGAPGPALDMVFEIGSKDNIEPFIDTKLAKGERLMGFGHRVYRQYDPRAAVLSSAAKLLYEAGGNMEIYTLAKEVEKVALQRLKEYKPNRTLETNVEYYTALLLHGINLSTDFFTPTFSIGRVSGWIGNCIEQINTGRLIRPSAEYIGEFGTKYIPLEER